MQPAEVQLRRFPYPYRAMLSICSDLDETPDRRVYGLIARFCNTTDRTPMGEGVGLEVGNSIYFDMPVGQFAYWNTDDAGREMIRTLIGSGHVDCLHSYGDLATTRSHAGRALEELDRHGCRLAVWIDHATAPTNLDAGIMRGHGDRVGHDAYHADLTVGHGVRYVWRGRVTSVTAQDAPARLGGIWTARHPLTSARTLCTEAAKGALGRLDHPKYAMHGPNRVLRPVTLRDGAPVMEFIRCNPHYGGVSSCDTGRGIGQVLTGAMLRRLTSREGVCILYTHLGKIDNPACPFDPPAVGAFRRLAEAADAREILVATTRRVLSYLDMRDRVQFSTHRNGDTLCIDAHVDGRGPVNAEGMTFHVPRSRRIELRINDVRPADVQINPPDHTGRPSVSVRWPRLEFPQW